MGARAAPGGEPGTASVGGRSVVAGWGSGAGIVGAGSELGAGGSGQLDDVCGTGGRLAEAWTKLAVCWTNETTSAIADDVLAWLTSPLSPGLNSLMAMFELQGEHASGLDAGASLEPQLQFQFQIHDAAPGGGEAAGSEVPVEQFQFQFHTHVDGWMVAGFWSGSVGKFEIAAGAAWESLVGGDGVFSVEMILLEFTG